MRTKVLNDTRATRELCINVGAIMFNFVFMLYLHLVQMLFGTSIPIFVYFILKKCFFLYL